MQSVSELGNEEGKEGNDEVAHQLFEKYYTQGQPKGSSSAEDHSTSREEGRIPQDGALEPYRLHTTERGQGRSHHGRVLSAMLVPPASSRLIFMQHIERDAYTAVLTVFKFPKSLLVIKIVYPEKELTPTAQRTS